LRAACAAGPDAIVVPKVSSADAVLALVEAMTGHGAPEHTKLWAMVETPIGMLNALSIAQASDRLTGFVMGTNDLVKELYAEHVPGRQPVITGLGLALLAARAAGIVIIDGVYNDVKNLDGFLAEVEQGRQMGFDGKTLIHPGQVEGANEAFAPSAQAVEDARGILAAWEARDSGVVTHNGRMIENLHVESAERTLAIAEGDLLAILSAGAYGMVMASNYNTRPRPCEVMVDGGAAHEVRARESVEALFALEKRLPRA
jgi:citrate lyase subunit beta/citryl-CoA lyase